MDSILQTSEEQEAVKPRPTGLLGQALTFIAHAAIALAVWFGLMLLGYAIHPAGVPQTAILIASMALPLFVGLIVARIWPGETATAVWLLGLIWMMIVSLHLLDQPTGPGHCFQCDAAEKLSRSFFSWPSPSGLLDDDGPFLATWPAAALLGYSIGAWLGRKR